MTCENPEHLTILYGVTAFCAFLSLLGCSFILLIYIYAKELREYPFKLIAYLAFCDTIKSIAIIIPSYKHPLVNTICRFQGYILFSFNLSNLVWVLSISFSLYQVIINSHSNIEKFHKYWVFLSFIFCPVISTLPFITNSYGNVYTWCTLKIEDGSSEAWRISLDYVPRWVSIFLIFLCYGKIYVHIKRNPAMFNEIGDKRKFLAKLFAYPAILLVAYIPLTLLRILQTHDSKCGFFSLAIFAYVCFSIYGFLNAVAYGYNETIREYLRDTCCKRNRKTDLHKTDLFNTFSEAGVN